MASATAKKLIEVLGKQYPADGYTNVTPRVLDLSKRKLFQEKSNPLYLISERIRHFFKEKCPEGIGYEYNELHFPSPIVTLQDNFDSLLIPKNHVSRSKSDTYYVNSDLLFRSHTSAHQMHCLHKGAFAFISIADCYRRDEIDRTHFPIFHQCEVFKLYNCKEVLGLHGIHNLYDKHLVETKNKQGCYSHEASEFVEIKLKSCVEKFIKEFCNDHNLKTRWVDAYFPFTHPSFELEIFWRDKWVEVLGCGIVRDQILRNAGIEDHIGFAAGFGLERFGMMKYQIPDIRLFWTKDSGFTHQFEDKTPYDEIMFVPFSSCPQCINDLSFWLPDQKDISVSPYSPNDFYDLCRTIGGDLIEQVKLIDEFTHPKTSRTSHCYRIIYRAADRVLTKEEVNTIHNLIASTTEEQCHVDLR